MGSKPNQPPLICVVGETASGKTALAIELARQFDGEIIAADSRTIYRGMDIGTAKPTIEERSMAPHYLIDISTPDRPVNVADFQHLANAAIREISSRNKLPIMVGGSGLYVDAVIYDFSFSSKPAVSVRQRLQQMSVGELRSELLEQGIPLPKNEQNPRHLMRALETGGLAPSRKNMRAQTLVIGIDVEREKLRERISARTEEMLQSGLVEEVRNLFDIYGSDCQPLQTIGYREFVPYFEGEATLEQVEEAIIKSSMQYAKRQRTWFRRNKSIHYIRNKEEAVALVTTFLNNVPIAN